MIELKKNHVYDRKKNKLVFEFYQFLALKEFDVVAIFKNILISFRGGAKYKVLKFLKINCMEVFFTI